MYHDVQNVQGKQIHKKLYLISKNDHYSVFHKSIAPSKELCSKMALRSHYDATPLFFQLQVTEDFFYILNFFIMEKWPVSEIF